MNTDLLLAGTLLLAGLLAGAWALTNPKPGRHRRRAAARAAEHVGATEAYADQLQAAGQLPVSDDLATSAERIITTHDELRPIGEAVEHFSHTIATVLRNFTAELDAETRMRLVRAMEWAADPQTGEIDMTELRQLLDEEDQADELVDAVATAGAAA